MSNKHANKTLSKAQTPSDKEFTRTLKANRAHICADSVRTWWYHQNKKVQGLHKTLSFQHLKKKPASLSPSSNIAIDCPGSKYCSNASFTADPVAEGFTGNEIKGAPDMYSTSNFNSFDVF